MKWERQRENHFYLDWKVTTIYVISQEQITCICRVSTYFKQLHQVELVKSGALSRVSETLLCFLRLNEREREDSNLRIDHGYHHKLIERERGGQSMALLVETRRGMILTSDRSINFQQVWFVSQNLCSFTQDEQCLSRREKRERDSVG